MKRILLLFLIAFTVKVAAQSAGFNNTFIVLVNNGQYLYYDLNGNTANYDFDNQTLGTFCQGSTGLIFKGGENNIWKCGGCDLSGTTINYRIYQTGTTPGSFSTYGLNHNSGSGNGCGGADQKWDKVDYNVNLVSGLAAGNYTIEVYCQGTTTCNGGGIYASNGGANYKAYFTVNATTAGGTVSSGQTVCSGSLPADVTLGGHTGTVTKWQRSTVADFLSNITDIVNTSATLPGSTIGALTQTTYFRAVVQSGICAPANSSIITIAVSPVSAGGSLSVGSYDACSTNNSGTLTLTGYTGAILKWQWSLNPDFSGTVTDINNTTATYNFSNLQSTTYYRAVVQSGSCGQAYSGNAAVAINANTWTGSASSHWDDVANWSCGVVPDANSLVVIALQDNQPVISAGTLAYAKTLTLDSDAQLTVSANSTLNVEGSITGSGLLFIENNAALLQNLLSTENANTAIATVTRNSNALFKLDYTLWGAPVTGQMLQPFSLNTVSNRFYTYNWNNTAEVYKVVSNPQTTAFNPGTGYLIRMPDVIAGNADYLNPASTTPVVFEGIFTGTPNNGTVTVPVTVGGINQANHFIAVGNPYPSPISVTAFFEQNSGILEEGYGMYFWRKKNSATTGSYAYLTELGFTANESNAYGDVGNNGQFYDDGESPVSDWIVSPGQGFLVRLQDGLAGTESVLFTNSMRKAAPATGGQPFFKTLNDSESAVASRLWLNLTNTGNAFSQAMVGYTAQATTGMDYGLDGKILSDGAAKLYSKAAGSNLVIQARPLFEAEDVVPLGYAVSTGGQYTISLGHADGIFASGQNIYLKDNLTGSVANLNENPYLFTTDAGTFDTRFEVVYLPAESLGAQAPGLANSILVYRQNGIITISSSAEEITQVTLYDVGGRKLYEKAGINAIQTTVAGLCIANGVLLVEINTLNGKVIKKIVY